MDMSIHNSLDKTAREILGPLIQVLLNHGMAHGAFAELARQVFVDEGFRHVERSGERATISAVAALTGLSRKEVKRLREPTDTADNDSRQRYNRAVRVISGWVNDPRFQDAQGGPAVLDIDGPDSSFAQLVRDYSGDVPVVAILKLLESGGNVVRKDNHVILNNRAYIPMSTPVDRLNILGTDVAELIRTIAHNMAAAPDARLFQRKVSNDRVSRDAVASFRVLSRERSQRLLEEFDQWLAEHEVDGETETDDTPAYVAVGIYYVEKMDQEAN